MRLVGKIWYIIVNVIWEVWWAVEFRLNLDCLIEAVLGNKWGDEDKIK